MIRILILIQLFVAWTGYGDVVGVVVLSALGDIQTGAQLSQRLARRLEETPGVRAQVISPAEFNRDDRSTLLSEITDLTARLRALPSAEAAEILAQKIGGAFKRLKATQGGGPIVQSAALRLAIYYRYNSIERMRWIDEALRAHPRFELEAGVEWDEGSLYPEVGFQIIAARKRLTHECTLPLSGLPPGGSTWLNGFAWDGKKVLYEGPFWLRVEASGTVWEREVGCSTAATVVRMPPAQLPLSKSMTVIERHSFDSLVVGVSAGRMQAYQVTRSGDFEELQLAGAASNSLADANDLAGRMAPLNLTALMALAPTGHTELAPQSPLDSAREASQIRQVRQVQWYNNMSLWKWLGATTVGLVVASHWANRTPTLPLEGRIE